MKIKAKSNVYKPLTADSWHAILQKGRSAMKENPYPHKLEYLSEKRIFRVFFTNNTAVDLPVDYYEEFHNISDADLKEATLSPAGTALCLDDYDLDVSVQGLINDNSDVKFFEVPNGDSSKRKSHPRDVEKKRLSRRQRIIRHRSKSLNKKTA